MINEDIKNNFWSEKFEKIIRYKKEQKQKYKNTIFIVLREFGACFPKEIKQILDYSAKYYAEGEYEKGSINKDEMENLIKKSTMPRETVQRKLKEMVDEGYIEKNNDGRYSISELAQNDLRHFNPESGKDFGELLLNSLLKLHFPTINDFKTNLEKLVKIFGFYLVYSLIEACRPIKIENKDKYIENRAKDGLTEKWFQQTIDHKQILDSFMAAVTNQYTDEQRKEYIKKHYRKEGKSGYIDYLNNPPNLDNPPDTLSDPKSAEDFCLIRFFNNTTNETYNKYRTTSFPSYELDNKCIDKINSILKKIYPEYYDMALVVRNSYLGRPKESSLKDRGKDFRYFNSKTEEMR